VTDDTKQLLALIESPNDGWAKKLAVVRLVKLAKDSDEAWEIFLTVSRMPNPAARLLAADAIGLDWPAETCDKRKDVLREAVLRLCDDEDRAVRRAVQRRIGQLAASVGNDLSGSAVSVLDQRVQRHRDGDYYGYLDALEELHDLVESAGNRGFIRDFLIPRLIEALNGGSYYAVRCGAAEMLYPREDVPESRDLIIPALISALGDSDPRIRGTAAASLGRYGARAQSAVPSLIKAVEQGSAAAALALGRIGEPAKAAVPALLEALNRRLPSHRPSWPGIVPPDLDPMRYAAIALVMLEAHVGAALDLITRVLLLHVSIHVEESDPDEQENLQLAADALARFGSECQSAVPALLQGLQDEWWPVRRYAASTLVRIGPPAEQIVPMLENILRQEAERHRDSECQGDYTHPIKYALDRIRRKDEE
jgi:hypothetical protein